MATAAKHVHPDQRTLVFQQRITDRFEKFDRENPAVYRELVDLARDLKARGFRQYSVDSLLHVIRFHRNLVDKPDTSGFEINNDFSSLYSRKIMATETDLAGFFETRNRRAQ